MEGGNELTRVMDRASSIMTVLLLSGDDGSL